METVYSFMSDVETPVSLFHKVSRDEPVAFLYESADGDTRLARYSLIGIDPAKTISFRGRDAVVEDRDTGRREVKAAANPLHFLRDLLEREGGRLASTADLPFTGGLVGYLGYAAVNAFDGIPLQANDPLGVPDGCYGLYDTAIVFDHLYRKIHLVTHRGKAYADKLLSRIAAPSNLAPLFPRPDALPESEIFSGVETVLGREDYCDIVRRCREFICEGQVFQIVPAHRFSAPVTGQALDIYRVLIGLNPSPYAYFLKFPNFTYLGSSPETFVGCRDGKVVLRALAGTRPRGATPLEDERLAAELRANEKELAEHRMLVDLERNDLGRVCRVGSIEVGEIATLVRYTHLMHLATEIRGVLRDDKSVYDVFQSCFPRGTVSGTPKIRAMQLLSTLEPERRGIYSGVVGYIDVKGNSDGAIAIRSALLKDGYAHVTAGAGVVYDSDPEAEYEETRTKAKSILRAIQLAERATGHGYSAAR